MIWTIIFFVSGGIYGFLLHLAGVHASDWLFWAFMLTMALSNFSIAKHTMDLVTKRCRRIIGQFYKDVLDIIDSAATHKEEANGLDKV